MKTTVQEVKSLCHLTWFIMKAFITVGGPSLYRRRHYTKCTSKMQLDKITLQHDKRICEM